MACQLAKLLKRRTTTWLASSRPECLSRSLIYNTRDLWTHKAMPRHLAHVFLLVISRNAMPVDLQKLVSSSLIGAQMALTHGIRKKSRSTSSRTE